MTPVQAPAGHTPGPWKAVLQYGLWRVRQDPANWNGMGYQHIATFPAERNGTHYGDMFAANARLVAAAPDLLEALRKLVDLADTQPFVAIGHLVEHVVPEARAALSRATGSEQ